MADYGTVEGGGYNAVSQAYKHDPSIEHYVKLRRENPDAEIEVSVVGGMDQLLFMEPELRKFGFDPQMVAAVLDSDPKAISELSLQIMERMIEARNLARSGQTHLARRGLAIPDKLISWLIACMLDSLSWTDELYMPRDLIVLVRERLGGSNLEYEQASAAHQKRWSAIIVGGQLKARGIDPSFRMLAKILKVSPTTVMRWFPDGEFDDEIARVSNWFDENGQMRALRDIAWRPLQTK
ncbi:hypothetical protein [Aurantimonas sp. VKM B-3413]|uniref:hypothetical protein n=1 Tax=Aurantimonas sp. VKM B-3413 TaxID=2779401 RepID=UPI001E4326E7|nr:hypothetical protein [Aurantimonas sp. VKM B-3413]MCB8836167.1 hypothetical protein [Aurantimonas sp. VKM B-3413]